MKRFFLLVLLLFLPSSVWAQITNEGFEEWNDVGGQEWPIGWSGSPFGVGKYNNSRSGGHAVSVWNWYYYGLGYVAAGERADLYFNLKYGGVPIDFVPTKLTGYYKYELGQNYYNGVKNDSAAVYVMVKRYNPELQDVDTISFAVGLFPPSSEWVPFSVDLPVMLRGVQPDSVAVVFYSSNPTNGAFCGPDSTVCCYLSVDDVALITTSGVPYGIGQYLSPARVVPNPVLHSGTIEFEGEEGKEYRIRLFDAAGNEVHAASFIGAVYNVDAPSLSAGVYHFTVADAANKPQAAGHFVIE